MSRRKQSKPRQIKRSLGELDGGEESTPDDLSLSGEEGGASDPDDSAEGDGSSPPPYTPLCNEEPRTHESADGLDVDDADGEEPAPTHSGGEEDEDGEEDEEEASPWTGPDDLAFSDEGGDGGVVTLRGLPSDTTWGPYPGAVRSDGGAAADNEPQAEDSRLALVCEDPDCWLSRVPLTSDASAANCSISSAGDQLFCRVTTELAAGEGLLASLSCPPGGVVGPPSSPASASSASLLARLSPPLSLVTQKQSNDNKPLYPAALRSDIQLLPQQAGMAAILATAVVNKDIFPCKDCGIWYRSERNLQAHLMYYCASRQKQPAAAAGAATGAAASSPPEDKPKESYPNERVCPFPQCNKSCPSASSLEIHMRTHSGERPFVCLICLSAFTTKANCERHLKVHTDTLNGVCHGCGFVSTTRDILYSHLVTSHMVCQPGSRSEVYSPGPGLPKLPVSTGLSPGDSGVVLKCQVCGHNSESPAQLQQHVRTHLEVRVPAERSPTPRQGTPSSASSPPRDGEASARVPEPGSSSPGANGGSATPPDFSPAAGQTSELKIKEEPRSDSEGEEQRRVEMMEVRVGEGEEEEEEEEEEQEEKAVHQEAASKTLATSSEEQRAAACQTCSSPKSPASASAAVKAEPTSPTPGSSPAPVGGAMFLPQYMFNPEAAILPQASEILAKMSEMVHSRLKQGQAVAPGNPPAFFPAGPTPPTAAAAAATPPHKGATCFECDITFNNINNFYAHKRLYCSSRHQGDAAAARDAAPGAVAPSGTRGPSVSPQGGTSSRAASASPTDPDTPASGGGGTGEPRRAVEVKTEAGREGVSSSSEGEGGGGGSVGGGGGGGGGRASEGSQSPASVSAEDAEDDPNRTFCEACNIRFSRHENYTVHKRFYCASRHDPSNQRATHAAKSSAAAAAAATTGGAFLPQPIRTRKRKKMYEIHMARTEALANAAAAAAAAALASAPSPSVLGLAVKQEVSPGAAGSSSPEGDGPIDLSKRPRLREGPRHGGGGGGGGILPALPLTDYHKCTACSISFNSIENYLAHKTYYCPATTLQPHTLEQLHRLHRPASTSPKSRPPQDLQHPAEAKAPPAEWAAHQARGASSSPRPSAASSSCGAAAASPSHSGAATPGAGAKGAAAPQLLVCPYCPNRPITCDLMEHFKVTHGLVVTVQPARSPSLSPGDGASATPPPGQARLAPRVHNGQAAAAAASGAASPVSPLANGSPSGGGGGGSPPAGSPLPVSPPSVTLSPVPDALRERPPDKPAPRTLAAAAASSPVVHNGNSRFCRLCNIKFTSLSTFIAHKKYYCSSHSAEHVK